MTYGQIQRGVMAADNFTQIANSLFRDPRLSAKAKGIFGFISTHRSSWGVTPESIAACMADGVSAINTGLRELEECGYLVRDQPRRRDGRMGSMVYRITDMPSSEPVVENRPPDVTCGNDHADEMETHRRRSEPVVDFPHAVHPRAADRPHKKTNSKNTILKNTSPSSVPQGGPTSGVPAGGGGGDAPPEQHDKPQQQDGRAAVFVDALPYGGRLPGPKQRAHLIGAVEAALACGWPETALRQQLTAETATAKSLSSVYRHRLEPENLPAPPVLALIPEQQARRACDRCETLFAATADPDISTCRKCRAKTDAHPAAQFGTAEEREAYSLVSPF